MNDALSALKKILSYFTVVTVFVHKEEYEVTIVQCPLCEEWHRDDIYHDCEKE